MAHKRTIAESMFMLWADAAEHGYDLARKCYFNAMIANLDNGVFKMLQQLKARDTQ